MGRSTIDFGIDLGTTTSSIALLNGTEPRVITDRFGSTFTPSAVWIDKRGQLHVGQEAKQRFEEDEENCDIEFKLRMGLGADGKKRFALSKRDMLPEEMSAEVLKSLKADVRSKSGEEIQAAVITVPCNFELPQCDATRRAAELSGFVRSPLLQEPVAAALAYGFQSSSEKVFWLVYDFGGGTFDAAVMQVRDGVIQVVNHAGDNHLGGKLLDWDVVEKRLIPSLTEKARLSDFRRGNPKWRAALAKLKIAAENAKIEVSRKEAPADIWIEGLCQDEQGNSVDFEYRLTPQELEEISRPYVTRSVNLCQKALSEKGLAGKDLEKVIMVGGTSLLPWVRRGVEEQLGVPLEFSVDPITVVARGAAIFAGTQRLPVGEDIALPEGAYRVELEYEPVGTEVDPPVGGRIQHPDGQSLDGYTIELVESRSQWRSGKIPLSKDGAFMLDAHAEKGRKCEFLIELCDPKGSQCETVPDRFQYTVVDNVFGGAPLIHSIGVAMANNRTAFFLKKGIPLPARSRDIHRTAYSVQAGQAGAVIKIPVVEGENEMRADRNRLIGSVEVPAERIRRDLSAGSEVEITLHVDESRIVTTKAYIPVLDEEFEAVLKLKKDVSDLEALSESVGKEKQRLTAAREKASRAGSMKAQEALCRIDGEDMVGQTEALLGAKGDPEALQACENRLLDLRAAIDEVEDALEWPTLVEKAGSQMSETRNIINEYGDSGEKAKLRTLERELRAAIDSGDPDLLHQRLDAVSSHGAQVLLRQPGFWVGYLDYLAERRTSMRDRAQADQLFTQGRRAINNNDVEGLKAVVRQLIVLLPSDEQEAARGYGGTTIR